MIASWGEGCQGARRAMARLIRTDTPTGDRAKCDLNLGDRSAPNLDRRLPANRLWNVRRCAEVKA
jgi:hypothetical protein